ncbi:MAG: extracellular solute-binding protein [Hyphomicrobiaceae bacterium]
MDKIWVSLSEKMCETFFCRPQPHIAMMHYCFIRDRIVISPKSAIFCTAAALLMIVSHSAYAEPGRERNHENATATHSEQKAEAEAEAENGLENARRSHNSKQLTATIDQERSKISSENAFAASDEATAELSQKDLPRSIEDQRQSVGESAPEEKETNGQVSRSMPVARDAATQAGDEVETRQSSTADGASEANGARNASREVIGETATARSQSEPSSIVAKETLANIGSDTRNHAATDTDHAERKLRISSWGGAYGQAQSQAIFKSIESQLGVKLERIAAAPAEQDNGAFDIVEVDQETLLNGCKTGTYSPIQPIDLPRGADGEGGAQDFIEGGLTKCGVGSFAWSSLVLVDLTKFEKSKPKTLADVFNTKRFRGKRAIPRRAENLLEALAMAAGTPRNEVYATLTDEARLDDLFKRLEQLLPHIVWVDDPIDAIAQLESGAAAFAFAYSGRAFRKTIAGGVTALWDGHIFDYGSWAISAEAKDKSMAKDFIALATSAPMLARQARLWPYGPMRKSAAAMVGRHALLDIELASFMPTSQIRLRAGLRRDPQFWSDNTKHLNLRLTQLLEGYPLGLRPPPPLRRPAPPSSEEDASDN